MYDFFSIILYLFVGGISRRKGIHHLLNVVSRYSEKEVFLNLVGSYNPNDFLYKEYHAKSADSFRGFVTRDQIAQIYSLSHLFVLPSLAEGMAMVGLEALASGLPILCTYNTGLSSIVKDGYNGFCIPVSDENALQSKIDWFLSHKKEMCLMSMNAEKSSDGYSWEEKEKETIRRKLGIQTPYLVLSVGQFIHRKGFDILLKAMKTVHADATLCLIGGTPTDEYNSIIKENKLTNVTFRPFLSKDELNEYYKASDLFVLPTREDIWGLVINEAMSQGLPVITTDRCVAGLELISDKNLIVPSEDSVDLGKAINNILDNVSFRRAISTYNLNKIRNYTIESMAASIFKTLSK